jgi:flagellar secretion chaperone FliS
MYSNRSKAYQETAIQTSSPTKLVVLLYEGAIRFLRESVAAIEAKNFDRKRQSIDRAVAIVQHLQSSLDTTKGLQVAADLDKLYGYIGTRILEGSTKLETAPIEEAIKLLKVLLAGWEEVANREKNSSATLPGQDAANRGLELHV